MFFNLRLENCSHRASSSSLSSPPFLCSAPSLSLRYHNHNCIFKMWADHRLSSTGASRQTRTNAMRQSGTPSATSNPSYNLRLQNQREHYYEPEDAQMTPRHRTTMNRSRSRHRPISGRAHQSRSQSRRRNPVSTTCGHHINDWLTRQSNGMGYANWALIAILTLTLVLAILLAYRNTNIWQYVAVLGSLLQWASTYITRSLDQVSPGLTTSLCKMPTVPWVLDCASPDATDSFMVIDKVNRDRISDAVIALTENTEDIFQAYTLVNQVMHDHGVLADQLPLDASSEYIEGLALLKVHIAAYDFDLDLTLRRIPQISARLRDLDSDEQPWTENIFELIAPWINARTKWGSFHGDMVHHLRDWATKFTSLYSRSKGLLSTSKTAKSWRSLGKAPEHTTGTIKTSEGLITAIEEALRLLNTTHNAAQTGLASMQAAERRINANGPTWKKYFGKRATHITNTLADLKEVSKLTSELRAHRKALRDAVEIVPGGGKLYTPDM
ncbi:hypothetical protein M438DRAFT_192680 [Aureobasidium pullulans EXF-150]|uniref:Uncharacterized protein n=1 Tax=Aureobasidium pullulans EXF-150 TaxID=1043002 RepID=A0A074XID2_AURPU|nr:uncharacterized protein M438DRAFT_192680 [Aureobasidium pullulans EXF-150]KEQ85253.1 hypothetical protein M438DRAFT_192680 [Aureobasidium pullulans EXF-150]